MFHNFGKTLINSFDLFAGRLKWSDIKQLLIYLTGLSWRLVCLVRYLNPVHYAWAHMRAPSFRHVDLQGVYYPAFKERMRSYFKSGQFLNFITSPLPVLQTGVMLYSVRVTASKLAKISRSSSGSSGARGHAPHPQTL